MKKTLLILGLFTSMALLSGCGSVPGSNGEAEGGTTGDGNNGAEVVGDTEGGNPGAEAAIEVDPAKATYVVEAGDVIAVNYIGALQSDDSVFDTSLEEIAKANDLYNPQRPYEPLTFTVGAKQMIPGFDSGVIGMKIGDEKEITIPAAEGYGERSDDMIQDLPSAPFKEAGIDPIVGEQYNFGIAPGTVLEIGEDTIKVDLNHFLAGKDLKFKVTLMDITKGDGVEVEEEAEVPADEAVKETEE